MLTYIWDFFDVYNIDHLNEWKIMQDTGMWRKGFLPENIYLPPNWESVIHRNMAYAWVEQALAGQFLVFRREGERVRDSTYQRKSRTR